MHLRKLHLVVLLAAALMVVVACQPNCTSDLERNKLIVQRAYEEVWNQGNVDLVDELVMPDYTRHEIGDPEDTGGIEPFKASVVAIRAAFPDLELIIEDIVAEGDRVATRSRFTGTHQGELMGIPATNRRVDVTAFEIVRIQDGKIAEIWRMGDMTGFMQQLGLAE